MARPVSNEANAISAAHNCLVLALQEKRYSDKSNPHDLASNFSSVLAMIGRIGERLENPSVRTFRDHNLKVPDVHEGSSVRDVLRRLRHQMQSACMLADLVHEVGPRANREEQSALDMVKAELNDLLPSIEQGIRNKEGKGLITMLT